jgi:vacuolar-type H+-ATPase subunit I/STV1
LFYHFNESGSFDEIGNDIKKEIFKFRFETSTNFVLLKEYERALECMNEMHLVTSQSSQAKILQSLLKNSILLIRDPTSKTGEQNLSSLRTLKPERSTRSLNPRHKINPDVIVPLYEQLLVRVNDMLAKYEAVEYSHSTDDEDEDEDKALAESHRDDGETKERIDSEQVHAAKPVGCCVLS